MTSPTPDNGRVLLICPRFFDYQERISSVLRSLGFEIVVLDDRPLTGAAYKTALRLAPAVTARMTYGAMIRHFEPVKGQHFDHILVVKGEAVSSRVLMSIRACFPMARFSLYLWDAVRNNRNSAAAASLYDAVSTFDPNDARAYGWVYRPLFAALTNSDQPGAKVFDWSFIGTLHSDRIAVLARLKAALDGRPYFIFGYYASAALFLLGRLKRAVAGIPEIGKFSTQSMDPAAVKEIVRQSRAIADIEHPQQVGLTIRTIETLFAGRKLMTTNAAVRESALYHPTRVCIINRHAPDVPASFFETDFEPVPEPVRYAYSDTCWARVVLGLPDFTPSTL